MLQAMPYPGVTSSAITESWELKIFSQVPEHLSVVNHE